MKCFQASISCRIRMFSQGCHVKCGKHPFLSHLKTKSKSGLELSLEQRCRMEVSLPRDKIWEALGNATSPGYLSCPYPSGSTKQHITKRIKKSLSQNWKRSSFWPKILKHFHQILIKTHQKLAGWALHPELLEPCKATTGWIEFCKIPSIQPSTQRFSTICTGHFSLNLLALSCSSLPTSAVSL